MQTGSVQRHGRGWRGYWRENGRRRATATWAKKGEARTALNRELDRIAMGAAYRAPITLKELSDRFLAQYAVQPQTKKYAERRLKRPLDAFGQAQASDITTEAIQRFLNEIPAKDAGKAYRRDITRTLRMVYRFGIQAQLLDQNPAALVKAPMQKRSEKMLPFESWAEVEAVASECRDWAPLVIFLVDTGARPGEAVALEHRHVDGSVVSLPGKKTDSSWRSVHMTSRGIAAVQSMTRAISTRRVFHVNGRPISWVYFWREIWRPALVTAGLEYRPPYSTRHTFAYWSLNAGVPIANVASDLGHQTTEQTFKVYGGWCRERGADAAAMREAWASKKKRPAGTNKAPASS